MGARLGCLPGGVSSTLQETIHREEPAMFANPHLILDLHAARAADLRAEAAHDRLVRALRRHPPTADTDRVCAAGAPRRWPRRRRAALS
jgi:hypothetical protein